MILRQCSDREDHLADRAVQSISFCDLEILRDHVNLMSQDHVHVSCHLGCFIDRNMTIVELPDRFVQILHPRSDLVLECRIGFTDRLDLLDRRSQVLGDLSILHHTTPLINCTPMDRDHPQ